jgi:CelD/BcsL family acetyltransferase involved in cellulose biosynthesis
VLAARLIEDLPALEELREEWDELAVLDALPLMAPDWVLPWLRRLAPAGAEPRVVVVYEGEELVGIAPFYVVHHGSRGRIDYRLPGIELGARLAPLAKPGREWEVAEAVAHTLAGATPRPDLVALESVPPDSLWLAALREQWPARIRPPIRVYHVHGSPTVTLSAGTFESWMASRSASFRKNCRRRGRMFEAEGGVMRLGSVQTLPADIETLMHLHTERWSERGESSLTARADRLPAMLEEAGRALTESGRFRIWVMEIEGRPIWANLFLAAGGELLAVNSGWDERWARMSPPLLGMLHAIEDAFQRGDRRLDLGIGDDPFKLQFADGNDPVAWGILLAPGARLPVTALGTAPMLLASALRDTAKRTLTPEQLDRLRRLRQMARR